MALNSQTVTLPLSLFMAWAVPLKVFGNPGSTWSSPSIDICDDSNSLFTHFDPFGGSRNNARLTRNQKRDPNWITSCSIRINMLYQCSRVARIPHAHKNAPCRPARGLGCLVGQMAAKPSSKQGHVTASELSPQWIIRTGILAAQNKCVQGSFWCKVFGSKYFSLTSAIL